jgi:NAD(P)-dependent dehydrogenase (short-subunit alcohol dehydrogenase family)
MGELTGRVAFVAGATGPIGQAVCRMLAASGASVAVHYRSQRDVAESVAASLPAPAVAVGADLTSAAEVERAIGTIADRLGSPLILVNAAHPPGSRPAPVAELGDDDLDRELSAVRMHALLCRAAVPAMRVARWGRVVYVAGALMARPAATFGAYGAAKAAASTLTRYLALEEGANGVTANVVAPGRVVDPADDRPLTPEQEVLAQRLLERMALPTFPTSDAVARVVLALLGPAGDAVTGQTVWVTGGEPIP